LAANWDSSKVEKLMGAVNGFDEFRYEPKELPRPGEFHGTLLEVLRETSEALGALASHLRDGRKANARYTIVDAAEDFCHALPKRRGIFFDTRFRVLGPAELGLAMNRNARFAFQLRQGEEGLDAPHVDFAAPGRSLATLVLGHPTDLRT